MESEFWHERWQRGEIGFHRSDVHWALSDYWKDIAGGRGTGVLVPLCGKSLDMRWLAERGHAVTGIELSRQAVEAFFDEWGRQPTRASAGDLVYRRAGGIELVEGDFFDYVADQSFELFYDRAALIALPQAMRQRYLDHLRSLLSNDASGLLVTFEYDQEQMSGPPFAVPEEELHSHAGLRFQLLERREVLAVHPGFAERGLTVLHECAWLVSPNH
ncbi:thiopurine S-methyltransferase [Wenzhouxiangella sp. EGI_FJ10409]|uniref:thiopurine S-methyltransferase n=1 Tax=Wenzhouxiangella sp. EGI_FJ10409 TaxID=3243767 RepID=UPI0035E207CC